MTETIENPYKPAASGSIPATTVIREGANASAHQFTTALGGRVHIAAPLDVLNEEHGKRNFNESRRENAVTTDTFENLAASELVGVN